MTVTMFHQYQLMFCSCLHSYTGLSVPCHALHKEEQIRHSLCWVCRVWMTWFHLLLAALRLCQIYWQCPNSMSNCGPWIPQNVSCTTDSMQISFHANITETPPIFYASFIMCHSSLFIFINYTDIVTVATCIPWVTNWV
jgi:hypothetical protein